MHRLMSRQRFLFVLLLATYVGLCENVCCAALTVKKDVWAPVCGDWEVRIDGGGEIYQADLLLELSGDSGQLDGKLISEGRKGRLKEARQENGALVLTFQTRRSGVPAEVSLAFVLVDGNLKGEIDIESSGRSRSYEFEANRLGPSPEAAAHEPTDSVEKIKTTSVHGATVGRVSLRQGVDGYQGALDTEIWGIAPTKPLDRQGTMTTDSNNGGGESQVLMKFTGLLGAGENQLPPGSRVKRAKLTIVVFDPGTTVYVHRVLAPWDASVTWDGMSSGLLADDHEAASLRDGFSFGEINMDRQIVEFDVTATVQKWADGEPNQGWVFINTGGNGWDFYSSDWVERDIRPLLEVEYEHATVEGHTPIASTGMN